MTRHDRHIHLPMDKVMMVGGLSEAVHIRLLDTGGRTVALNNFYSCGTLKPQSSSSSSSGLWLATLRGQLSLSVMIVYNNP